MQSKNKRRSKAHAEWDPVDILTSLDEPCREFIISPSERLYEFLSRSVCPILFNHENIRLDKVMQVGDFVTLCWIEIANQGEAYFQDALAGRDQTHAYQLIFKICRRKRWSLWQQFATKRNPFYRYEELNLDLHGPDLSDAVAEHLEPDDLGYEEQVEAFHHPENGASPSSPSRKNNRHRNHQRMVMRQLHAVPLEILVDHTRHATEAFSGPLKKELLKRLAKEETGSEIATEASNWLKSRGVA